MADQDIAAVPPGGSSRGLETIPEVWVGLVLAFLLWDWGFFGELNWDPVCPPQYMQQEDGL